MKESRLDYRRIAEYGIFVFVGLMPFLPILTAQSWLSVLGVVKDLICIVVLFASIAAMREGSCRIPIYVLMCVGLYISVTLCGILVNDNLSIAQIIDAIRWRALYPLTVVLFLWCEAYDRFRFKRFQCTLFNLMYITIVIVAIVGVIELIAPAWVRSLYGSSFTMHSELNLHGTTVERIVSTVRNPINFGIYMALGVCLGFWKLRQSKSKAVIFAGIILFFVLGFMSFSRAAMLACIFAAIFGILMNTRDMKFSNKAFLLTSVVIVSVGIVAIMGQMDSSIFNRLSSISLDNYANNSRMDRIDEYLNFDLNNIPIILFGNGAGSFMESEASQYVFEQGYVSIFYESGLVSLLSYFVLVIMALVKFRTSKNDEATYRQSAIWIAILGVFSIAMLSNDCYMQLPGSFYIWYAMISVVVSVTGSQDRAITAAGATKGIA